MRPGLRAQLLLGLTLVTLTVMVSVGWFALVLAERGMDETRDDLLARSAAALAGSAVPPGGSLGDVARRLDAAATDFLRAAGAEELVYADPMRRVVVAVQRPGGSRSPSAAGAVLDELEAALALRSGTRVYSMISSAAYLYEPIRAEGRLVGIVRVRAGREPAHIEAIGRARRLLVGLSIVDGVVLLGVGAFILGRYVVRPVEDLSRAARRVAGGDLGHTVVEAGAGEIADLARSFNQMSAALRFQREQIVRSEKLASVGRLAAGVAHEVGNPLASVLGYAEILATGQSSPEEVRDHAGRIRRETERIHRILTELLEYSRPPREDIGPVSVGAVLESARSLLAPQPRVLGVEVVSDLAADLPPVAASAGRLTQVIVNLLLNAADAMQTGGRVTVSARLAGERVEIRVADSGPGVPPDLIPRLFEPFFTTKEPGRGTGLGLAVCQSIVESMGGAIGLDGRAGDGATFVVALPVWRG